MPQERLSMRKIRDVLRLSAGGLSKRKIAASLGMSATAAGDCMRRERRAGLSWPLSEDVSDAALEARLYRLQLDGPSMRKVKAAEAEAAGPHRDPADTAGASPASTRPAKGVKK
jgi:hypothetical protein